ncbi:MAG: pectate lyase, partial [Bacillota bacterium]
NNHFVDVKDPIGSWYSDEDGYWDLSNNEFENCTGNIPTNSTVDYSPPYDYENVLDPVEEIKSILSQYAGIGQNI